MLGLMQNWQMTADKVIDHARINHGAREIVTRSVEGPIVRTTYADVHRRAKQVSNALLADGIGLGDRVATLAWNSARHMEAWYGTMGIGAVLHTLNPRLFPEQLVYIVNHAEDRVIITDLTFLPILEAVQDKLATVTRFVVLTDDGHMPATTLRGAVAYESWIASQPVTCAWGGFDENTAAGLCYTSGTTGNPKGVLYSHRSNILHTLLTMQTDVMGLSANDTILPVVPMFHANAWGVALSAPAAGSKMVMPGARMDGAAIHELLETEKVTFTAAVPTVWLMLLQHLEATNSRLTTLKRVVIGGSAVPEKILRTFEDKYGVDVRHAWGMTELSPLGTLGAPGPEAADLGRDDMVKLKLKQGRALRCRDEDPARWRRGAARRGDLRQPRRPRSGHRRCLLQGRGRQYPGWRRVLRYRRCRHHRRARLHADHGPVEGRDQVRRRMDQFHRCRERGCRRAGCRQRSGDRQVPSQVGRASAADHRSRCGGESDQGRGSGLSRWQDRQVVDAGRRPVCREDPAGCNRQDQQAGAARHVQGL
jgi:acyl-CoA synthetase (AMP-forming)/AMP-acid ligase II